MCYMFESGKIEGNMVDRYSDIIFIISGWKEFVSWKIVGLSG